MFPLVCSDAPLSLVSCGVTNDETIDTTTMVQNKRRDKGVLSLYHTSLESKSTIPLPSDLKGSEICLDVTVAQGSMTELLNPKLMHRTLASVEDVLGNVYTSTPEDARYTLKVKVLMVSDGTISGTLSAMGHSPRISEPMVALCYQLVRKVRSTSNHKKRSRRKKRRKGNRSDEDESKEDFNNNNEKPVTDEKVYQGGLAVVTSKLPFNKCVLDMSSTCGANEVTQKVAPQCANKIIDKLNIGGLSKSSIRMKRSISYSSHRLSKRKQSQRVQRQ